jgi:hypothetical protein
MCHYIQNLYFFVLNDCGCSKTKSHYQVTDSDYEFANSWDDPYFGPYFDTSQTANCSGSSLCSVAHFPHDILYELGIRLSQKEIEANPKYFIQEQ